MKLVGFNFIATQEEFEKWQIEHPEYEIRSVMPHVMEINMAGEEKYGPAMRGATRWGVFVTYLYESEI